MVILTIKFPKGTKTYDYLMYNPEKVKLDKEKPLKFVTGTGYGGLSTQSVWLVKGYKVEKLPSHVTTQLVLGENNVVHSKPIDVSRLASLRSVPHTSTITTTVKPKTISKIEKKPFESVFFDLTWEEFIEKVIKGGKC